METFIRKAEDLETVNANFMPPLLDAILGDYNRNVPAARDAEVLNVMATIISRLGVRASDSLRSHVKTDDLRCSLFLPHKSRLSSMRSSSPR